MTNGATSFSPAEQRSFAQELIRQNATELPVKIRFFAEVGCDFALWDPDNAHIGELEDRLPMSRDLRDRIKAWAMRGYRHDAGEQRMTAATFGEFVDEGRVLSKQLQEALGPDFLVLHHP